VLVGDESDLLETAEKARTLCEDSAQQLYLNIFRAVPFEYE